VSCTCQDVYAPFSDRQHFCMNCKEWFHEGCLGEPVELDEEPHHNPNPSINKLLNAVPICRGSGGVENRLADWHVVGSGRRLKKVEQWVTDGTLPDDWKTHLGLDFVKDMLDTEWAFYQCPSCELII